MLDERLPFLEVRNISDLLDPSDNLDLLAANGTSIPYKGWPEINLNILILIMRTHRCKLEFHFLLQQNIWTTQWEVSMLSKN